jgi:hypothetical protein
MQGCLGEIKKIYNCGYYIVSNSRKDENKANEAIMKLIHIIAPVSIIIFTRFSFKQVTDTLVSSWTTRTWFCHFNGVTRAYVLTKFSYSNSLCGVALLGYFNTLWISALKIYSAQYV